LSSARLPVLGQLARVRGRHWVVTDVAPTSIPFDIKSSTVGEGQTLITLSSVEDDGLGEELRVLWELEAGRKVLDAATLPTSAKGGSISLRLLARFWTRCAGVRSRMPTRLSVCRGFAGHGVSVSWGKFSVTSAPLCRELSPWPMLSRIVRHRMEPRAYRPAKSLETVTCLKAPPAGGRWPRPWRISATWV
jgi:hypothetical protein